MKDADAAAASLEEITQNTTAIKDVSDEITASAMRDLDQAHNLKGRATNLNQQVSTFIL